MASPLQMLTRAVRVVPQAPYQPIAPFLYPFLQQQRRSASILSGLSNTKGSYNKRIRRGRGPASGKGKTSGRGHKGQGQHGKVPYGFNGGQTPDEVVAGPRGFDNFFSVAMAPLNLDRIQVWIDKGLLDPSQPITLKELHASRCVHQVKDGIKLLARGKNELTSPINLIVSRASAEAIATIEKLGGTVTTRYYTDFAIKKILKGEMDPIHSSQSRIEIGLPGVEGSEARELALQIRRTRYKYRLPDPVSRKNLEYYRDTAHRGYLSHLVEKGHGPSLFFKPPAYFKPMKNTASNTAAGETTPTENRLW